MACIRKRRGKWVADWRDGTGRRNWKTFSTRREAEDFLDKERPAIRQWQHTSIESNITVDAYYMNRWLGLIQPTIKRRTFISYKQILTTHILPILGSIPVRRLHRSQIKDFLSRKLRVESPKRLTKNTVRNIHAALRSMLRAAVDDGILISNPAELGRQLRLITPKSARQENIKAMTREQRQLFLATAQHEIPRLYPLFATLAGTGIRLGEALALRWDDLDYEAREIRIERAFPDDAKEGEIETPKSGHGRTVDMSRVLSETLRTHELQARTRNLGSGQSTLNPWVVHTSTGHPFDASNLRREMKNVLRKAALPIHFTPHCLRHTYASLMLQQGESVVYVQRQLGHASIQLTVDTYGKWLPMGNKAAVDRLDGESGSKMVAMGACAQPHSFRHSFTTT
jgi:integrase